MGCTTLRAQLSVWVHTTVNWAPARYLDRPRGVAGGSPPTAPPGRAPPPPPVVSARRRLVLYSGRPAPAASRRRGLDPAVCRPLLQRLLAHACARTRPKTPPQTGLSVPLSRRARAKKMHSDRRRVRSGGPQTARAGPQPRARAWRGRRDGGLGQGDTHTLHAAWRQARNPRPPPRQVHPPPPPLTASSGRPATAVGRPLPTPPQIASVPAVVPVRARAPRPSPRPCWRRPPRRAARGSGRRAGARARVPMAAPDPRPHRPGGGRPTSPIAGRWRVPPPAEGLCDGNGGGGGWSGDRGGGNAFRGEPPPPALAADEAGGEWAVGPPHAGRAGAASSVTSAAAAAASAAANATFSAAATAAIAAARRVGVPPWARGGADVDASGGGGGPVGLPPVALASAPAVGVAAPPQPTSTAPSPAPKSAIDTHSRRGLLLPPARPPPVPSAMPSGDAYRYFPRTGMAWSPPSGAGPAGVGAAAVAAAAAAVVAAGAQQDGQLPPPARPAAVPRSVAGGGARKRARPAGNAFERSLDRSRLYDDALDSFGDAPSPKADVAAATANGGRSLRDAEVRPVAGGRRGLDVNGSGGVSKVDADIGDSLKADTGVEVSAVAASSDDGIGVATESASIPQPDVPGILVEPPPVTPSAPGGCGRSGEPRRPGRPPGRGAADGTSSTGRGGGIGDPRGPRGSARGGALSSALAPSHWPKTAAALWSWPPVSRYFADVGADDLAALAPPAAAAAAARSLPRKPASRSCSDGGLLNRVRTDSPPPRNGKRARVSAPLDETEPCVPPGITDANALNGGGPVDSADEGGRPLPPRGRYYRLPWLEDDARREANLHVERSPTWSRRPLWSGATTGSSSLPDLPTLRLSSSPIMGADNAAGGRLDAGHGLRLSARQRERQAVREALAPLADPASSRALLPEVGHAAEEVFDDMELDAVYCSQRLVSGQAAPSGGVAAATTSAAADVPRSPAPVVQLAPSAPVAPISAAANAPVVAPVRRKHVYRTTPPVEEPTATTTQARALPAMATLPAPRKLINRERLALGNGILAGTSPSGTRGSATPFVPVQAAPGKRGGAASSSKRASAGALVNSKSTVPPGSRKGTAAATSRGSAATSASRGSAVGSSSRGSSVPPVPRKGLSREKNALGNGVLPVASRSGRRSTNATPGTTTSVPKPDPVANSARSSPPCASPSQGSSSRASSSAMLPATIVEQLTLPPSPVYPPVRAARTRLPTTTPGRTTPPPGAGSTPSATTPAPRAGLSRERKSLGDGILPVRTRHGVARQVQAVAAPFKTEAVSVPDGLSETQARLKLESMLGPKPELAVARPPPLSGPSLAPPPAPLPSSLPPPLPPPVPLPAASPPTPGMVVALPAMVVGSNRFASGARPGTSASFLVELLGPNPSACARASLRVLVPAARQLPGMVDQRLPAPALDDFELTLPPAAPVVPLDPLRAPASGELGMGAHARVPSLTTVVPAMGTAGVGLSSTVDASFLREGGGLPGGPGASDESDEVSMEIRRLQAELVSVVRAHAPLRSAVQARAHVDMAESRAIAARKREERVLLGKLREFRRAKHSVRAYSRSPGGGPSHGGYGSARASPISGGPSPRSRRPRRADAEAASPDAIAALALPSSTTPGTHGRVPALPPLVLDMNVLPELPGGAVRTADGGDALDAAFGKQGAAQVRGEADDSTKPLTTQLLGWVEGALLGLRGFAPGHFTAAQYDPPVLPADGSRPSGAANSNRGASNREELGAGLLALSKVAQAADPQAAVSLQGEQTVRLVENAAAAAEIAASVTPPHDLLAAVHAAVPGLSADPSRTSAAIDVDVRQLRPTENVLGAGALAAGTDSDGPHVAACKPVYVDAAEAWQRFRLLRLELERTRTLAALIQRRENLKKELADITFQRYEATLVAAQEHIEDLEPTPLPPRPSPPPASPETGRPLSLTTPIPAVSPSSLYPGVRGGVAKPVRRSPIVGGPRRAGVVPALPGGLGGRGVAGRPASGGSMSPGVLAASPAVVEMRAGLRRVLGLSSDSSVSDPTLPAKGARLVAAGSGARPATPASRPGAAVSFFAMRPSFPVSRPPASSPAAARTGARKSSATSPAIGLEPVSFVGATDSPVGGQGGPAALLTSGSSAATVKAVAASWSAVQRAGGGANSGLSLGAASPASRVTAPAPGRPPVPSLEGHTAVQSMPGCLASSVAAPGRQHRVLDVGGNPSALPDPVTVAPAANGLRPAAQVATASTAAVGPVMQPPVESGGAAADGGLPAHAARIEAQRLHAVEIPPAAQSKEDTPEAPFGAVDVSRCVVGGSGPVPQRQGTSSQPAASTSS